MQVLMCFHSLFLKHCVDQTKPVCFFCSFFVGIIHVASDAAPPVIVSRIPICYVLNYVTFKMPNVTVFVDCAFKEVIEVKWGHKGGALIQQVQSLYKKTKRDQESVRSH